ncbi:interferon-like [Pseudopipra pipra]|uniref:interferon-like n=1 Tax=Pseudopipra pipra TaxID=415032 RepID=UPI00313A39C4
MAVPGSQQPCLRNGTLALLLLLTALTSGLPCHPLQTLDNAFPWEQLQLLDHMAPNSTHTCQLQNPPFFPDTLRHNNLNPQQAAAAALRILQHLFHTLSINSTSQHWHIQPRHRLLNQLQHHIHRLEQCCPDNACLFKGPRNLVFTMKRYFRGIHLFLHAHNHSACAWEHIRLEAIICFQRVDTLLRRMKHQGALDPTKPTDSQHPSPVSASAHGWRDGSSSPGWDHSAPLTPPPATMLS